MTRSDSMLGDMKAFLNMRGLMRSGTPFMSMNCTPALVDGKTQHRIQEPSARQTAHLGRQALDTVHRERAVEECPEAVCRLTAPCIFNKIRKETWGSHFSDFAARATPNRVSET